MTRERYTLRTSPGGAAASGLGYTIKLHADDSPLDSGVTDGSGQALYVANLSPGPHYFTGTDTAPTPDAVRVVSSTTMGSGGSYSLAEVPYALRALGTGVVRNYLNTCAVSYDGAGLDLDTNTGSLLILGIPLSIASSMHQSVTATRDATNPKQCYWVVEVTGPGQTNEGKAVLKEVCGTAAASPALPSLTQTEATYQFPLATFRLPNTGSTTLTQLADVRAYLQTRNPVVTGLAQRTDPAVETTTTATGAGVSAATMSTTITLLSGVAYDIQVRTFLTVKISATNFQASVAARINGVVGTYSNTNSTSYVGLFSSYSATIIGTGAAIDVGTQLKVTGGTMTYTVGTCDIVATPRS